MKHNSRKLIATSLLVIGLERFAHFGTKSALPMWLVERGVPIPRVLALNDLLTGWVPTTLLLGLIVGLVIGARRTAVMGLLLCTIGSLLVPFLPMEAIAFPIGAMATGGGLFLPAFYLWFAQNCANTHNNAGTSWTTWLNLVICAELVTVGTALVGAFVGGSLGASMPSIAWTGATFCTLAAMVVVVTSSKVHKSASPAPTKKTGNGVPSSLIGVFLMLIATVPALLLQTNIPMLSESSNFPASPSGRIAAHAFIPVLHVFLLLLLLTFARKKKMDRASMVFLLAASLLCCAGAGGVASTGDKGIIFAQALLTPLGVATVAMIARVADLDPWRYAYVSIAGWLSISSVMMLLGATFTLFQGGLARAVLSALCLVGGVLLVRNRNRLDQLIGGGSGEGGQ